ncbi:MAG: phasin family protein [Pseudomonadota bacterium]
MTDSKKTANPFAFDVNSMFSDFDPNKMMSEYAKAFSEFNIPGVDANSIAESQQKNLEALVKANQIAIEGMQSVFQRQAEIMNTAMHEMQSVFQELSSAGEPKDKIAEQTDLMKSGIEKALKNMEELASMAGKSNSEAFDVIHARFTESLEEVKAEMLKSKL